MKIYQKGKYGTEAHTNEYAALRHIEVTIGALEDLSAALIRADTSVSTLLDAVDYAITVGHDLYKHLKPVRNQIQAQHFEKKQMPFRKKNPLLGRQFWPIGWEKWEDREDF